MQRNKIIILISGIIILIILTSLMIFLEDEEASPNRTETSVAVNDGNQEVTEENNREDETETQLNSNINIENEGQTVNEVEESELRSHAEEAITTISLDEAATEMSEDTLYEHALLSQTYQLIRDDQSVDEEDIERDANWMSIERNEWVNRASEKYDFNYSPEQFLQFVEQEDYIENEDESTKVLFEELAERDENLLHRHLEFQYIKMFVWDSINEMIAEQHSENGTEEIEDETQSYQLFLQFEQEIMEHLVEAHPEHFEAE